jgi:hypothetical protein
VQAPPTSRRYPCPLPQAEVAIRLRNWTCAQPSCARDALVRLTSHGAQTWSRAALLDADKLPEPTETMLATLAQADLPLLAASHLLDADTRPDTLLLWDGDPDEPWPLGAWLVGATVLLRASSQTLPPAGATLVRAAPARRG